MLEAGPAFSRQPRACRAFVLATDVPKSSPPKKDRMWLALLLTALMVGSQILAGALKWDDRANLWVVAALTAALMLGLGCLSAEQARGAFDWEVYITIAFAFGISTAMEKTKVIFSVRGKGWERERERESERERERERESERAREREEKKKKNTKMEGTGFLTPLLKKYTLNAPTPPTPSIKKVARAIAELFVALSRAIGGQTAALTCSYLVTALLSELLTNNAAAALMFPIASSLAEQLGVPQRLMSAAVMLGGSAGWILPYSYQCNLMGACERAKLLFSCSLVFTAHFFSRFFLTTPPPPFPLPFLPTRSTFFNVFSSSLLRGQLPYSRLRQDRRAADVMAPLRDCRHPRLPGPVVHPARGVRGGDGAERRRTRGHRTVPAAPGREEEPGAGGVREGGRVRHNREKRERDRREGTREKREKREEEREERKKRRGERGTKKEKRRAKRKKRRGEREEKKEKRRERERERERGAIPSPTLSQPPFATCADRKSVGRRGGRPPRPTPERKRRRRTRKNPLLLLLSSTPRRPRRKEKQKTPESEEESRGRGAWASVEARERRKGEERERERENKMRPPYFSPILLLFLFLTRGNKAGKKTSLSFLGGA